MDKNKGRRLGGLNSYKNKTGIHALTKEQRSEQGKLNINHITHEQKKSGGRKSGKMAFENKTGIHALPKEVKQEQGKHAAESTKNTLWVTNVYTKEKRRIPKDMVIIFLEENILEWKLGYHK